MLRTGEPAKKEMQGGRDPFFGFGDPFGGFGSFGSFGGQRNLISSFFGGRDPFDDPFFTRPFGSMFESDFFGSTGGPLMNPHASGFLEHQPAQSNRSRGPIIEELNSDDEKDEKESGKEKKENPRKHGRSSREPLVEDPDDEATGVFYVLMVDLTFALDSPSRIASLFKALLCLMGANGAYYTSSRTRRMGMTEVSRGIHDKGHSLTRKLKSDGHVDTMQTLHNLNEDELAGFEEAWKGNVRKHLPGLSEEFTVQDVMRSASSSQQRSNRGGWALPSTERSNNLGSLKPEVGGTAGSRHHSGRMRTHLSDGAGSSRVRTDGVGYGNQAQRH
ncbi:hypothetical protein Sango_2278100 [Sesamum angolense]|uniref:Glycine-rich protein n=1 Tax=Sesamum angolense TaxID=2727404 RepID=A0AAE1W9T8_9LAMI|nr:hypothetical protein Sango_2278100 [Sesamum angolense]